MKKIKLLFVLLTSALLMQAQTTYNISGLVVTNNYLNVVPNHPVTVIDSSVSGMFVNVAIYNYVTDTAGSFSDSILSQGATGTLWFLAPDSCGFATMAISYSPNSPSTLATAGMVLCNNNIGSPTQCNYNVNALPVAGFPNAAAFSTNGGNQTGGSSYLWTFGDGSTSTQASPIHTYAQAGTYQYCLQIDSCPAVCDSITVFSQGGGCDPFFVPSVNGNTVDIFPALLTGQFVAIVDWGDGVVDTFTPANIPVLPNNISHTYANPGNYSICLTHSNASLGCSNTHCTNVTVTNSGPSITCNANFIVDTVNSLLGNVVVWNNSSATLTGTGQMLTSFYWDFGDGNSSTQQFPLHNYANPGLYQVCLTITAILPPSAISPGDTCTSTYCDSLGVDANGNLIYKGVATGWTLKVLNPNTIGIKENELSGIRSYPNPVTENVTLEVPAEINEPIELSLYTINGALLAKEIIPAGSTTHNLNMSALASGMYMLNMNMNGITKRVKLVKQ